MTEAKALTGVVSHIQTLWKRDPKGMSIDLLRVGMGLIWALNLIFILAPSNRYFSMFQTMASGFGPTTLGGAGFANWVAGSPLFFAWAIAILTGYLAFAFLAGFTTRLACIAGAIASVAFLLTQFYSTFTLNGMGTDVGPHPLYLLIYLILFTAGAGQYFALDHWMWASGKARFPRLSRWIASPRDLPCNATCPSAGLRAPSTVSEERSSTVSPEELSYTGAPTRPSHRKAIVASVFIVLLLVVAGVVALHPSDAGRTSAPAPTKVSIQDIVYHINYPGGASQGGFGPSQQDGCWLCAVQVQPGSSVLEVAMLTNNHSGTPVTVTSLVVAPPFTLVSGPNLPQTVPVGRMWMFNVNLGTPAVAGDYTVQVTFTTQ